MQLVGRGIEVRHTPEPHFICSSAAMTRVRDLAVRIAPGSAKVLITGESGVGKDLVARFIHARSLRARRPFVAVNCGAVSETLLESELFGHVRGSFTGAYRDKVGKLELADDGTIFLDEVADMSLRMQVMLLRFLENGEIQPVGADAATDTVDVRVIAATNRDLPALVAEGRFREDLLYRLKVAHLHVPPLRERREEIRALVGSCLAASGLEVTFSEEALAQLEAYCWPGNVRELQNVVESVIWTAGTVAIGPEHLPPAICAAPGVRVAQGSEPRREAADDLFEGLVSGTLSFWQDVYRSFMDRDLTRRDIRHVVCRGLTATGGNYRALLRMLGLPPADYKKFLNFLATHGCAVDFRPFRRSAAEGTGPGKPLVRRSAGGSLPDPADGRTP